MKITYGEALKEMDNKSFYCEKFGGVVTVKNSVGYCEDDRVIIIGSKQDVRDLYESFKSQL